MAEDLVKDGTKFVIGQAKNAVLLVAFVLAVIIALYLISNVVDVAIVIVKQGINLLQYAVNALL